MRQMGLRGVVRGSHSERAKIPGITDAAPLPTDGYARYSVRPARCRHVSERHFTEDPRCNLAADLSCLRR